jgi:hypothetical protein
VPQHILAVFREEEQFIEGLAWAMVRDSNCFWSSLPVDGLSSLSLTGYGATVRFRFHLYIRRS